ncbi:MAG: sulfatase [Candidatus Aminicenantes bacterium]|nr:sulfatase [Candidatus Aminicenantes bacterium]
MKTKFGIVCFVSPLILSLLIFNACAPSENQNLILITLDTHRADYMGAYNEGFVSTPNLDFLAREGTLFTNCFSPIPVTLPAHSSLFYSQPPYKLKIYNNGETLSADGIKSLAEIFKENGYLTGAFVSLGVLLGRYGLNQGFDTYSDQFPETRWYLTAEEVNSRLFPWLEKHREQNFFLWIHYSDPHDPYAPPDLSNDLKIYLNDNLLKELCLQKNQVEDIALPLNKGKNTLRLEVTNEFIPKKDAFLARLVQLELVPSSHAEDTTLHFGRGWLNTRKSKRMMYFKNNAILKIQSPKDQEGVILKLRGKLDMGTEGNREMYRREVEYLDREIGSLFNTLKTLDLFEKTIIVSVGDHGEGLGEYESSRGGPHFGHIHYLYSVYLKVPFVIWNPAKRRNQTISRPATLIDTAPTVLALMDIDRPSHMMGRNLMKGKKTEDTPTELFFETYEPEADFNRFAILSFPDHLIFTLKTNAYELYDISSDPKETTDLYPDQENDPRINRLREKLNDYTRRALSNRSIQEKDEKTVEMLKALGYIK